MTINLEDFPPYPEYQSPPEEWMEKVPSTWSTMRARFCFEEVNERSETGEQVLFSLSKTKGLIPRSEITDDIHRADSLEGYKICRDGDIVMNKMQAWNGVFGIADQTGIVSPDYTVFRSKEGVNSNYYLYLLKTQMYVGQFKWRSRGIGTAYLRLHTGHFYDVPLIFPSPEEQSKIASFLDHYTAKIDELISKKQRLSELLDEKLEVVISEAVTKGLSENPNLKESSVESLGKIPEDWEALRLKFILDKIEQGWSPQCEDRTADIEEWGVLKAGAAKNGRFLEDENKFLPLDQTPKTEYEVESGDLLMNRASGSPDLIGSVALVKDVRPRLLLCDKLFRLHIREERAKPEFLALALRSHPIRHQIVGAISGANGLANNLPQSEVKELALALPPLSDQEQIANNINEQEMSIRHLQNKIEEGISLLQEKRQALVTAVVTGQIDVSGWQAVGQRVPA